MQRLPQAFKVTWMILWRAWLVEAVFFQQTSFIPLVVAAAIGFGGVFALNKTIAVFPLWRAFFKKPVVLDIREQNHPTGFKPPQQASNQPQNSGSPSNSYSQGGSFEYVPRALERIPEPAVPQMFGKPGRSLSSAKGISTSNAASGQLGEVNFAKALAVEGLINKCTTLWSVKMPGKMGFTPDSTLNTDIDCMLFTNGMLLLLDMKLYTGGDITYKMQGDSLLKFDNQTQMSVGQPIKMSRNMEIARERFARLYPNLDVYAMVVFMPTDKGSSALENVFWPGNVPAVNLVEIIAYLKSILPTYPLSAPDPASRSALRLLA